MSVRAFQRINWLNKGSVLSVLKCSWHIYGDAVWPHKNRQMSIKVAQKMTSLEKWMILTPLQKLPRNVEDLGKLIFAKGFKKWPKVQ